MSDADRVRRFLLEPTPVRGHCVHLESSWRQLLAHTEYPPAVRALLGEAVAASALLAATLKFEGVLTLQLQGDGLVRLLVAQCTHDHAVRGVARFAPEAADADFRALVGSGTLTVTVESNDRRTRYQGVVPLDGNSLATALQAYFARSEQIPSAVALATDESRAVGLLVQKIATEGGVASGLDSAATEAVWQRARAGVEAVDSQHLLGFAPEELVRLAAGGEDVRLFAGHELRFECRCSAQRVAWILRALGPVETRSVLAEQGAVTVTCEFCQRPYRFDAIDVERLFGSADEMAPGSERLN
jgi:molecular chaperone Hsp33